MKSRHFVTLALGVSFAALAAASALADQLSVMSFGGAYQEAERQAVFEPYAAKTGTRSSSRNTAARSPRSKR